MLHDQCRVLYGKVWWDAGPQQNRAVMLQTGLKRKKALLVQGSAQKSVGRRKHAPGATGVAS